MPPLRVRAMRTRWGSLAPSGTVTLNAELVRATSEQLDYVIFHELCHLRVRGHGRDFYGELARYVPEWRRVRRALHAHPL
jgi:predicted metal-dependent hydrolase